MAKQDLYNLFIVFAKRGFGNAIIHFVPAKSGSLSELYGNILIVDFFHEVLVEVFLFPQKVDICFFSDVKLILFALSGKRIFINSCGLIFFISVRSSSDTSIGNSVFSSILCG